MRLFEKTPEAMTGSRIAAVDYAKTLAIVCVVTIHVSSEVLLGRQIGSAAWLEGLFWSSLARGAVPLFLMCSGVLFLDRSGGLSVRRIWKRNHSAYPACAACLGGCLQAGSALSA